jgi:Ni,Fe-hydrogenase III component G
MQKLEKIKAGVNNSVDLVQEKEGTVILKTDASHIKETLKILILEDLRFIHLTAIDFTSQKEKIELNYFFMFPQEKLNIILKTNIDSSNPKIDSISDIIPGAIWAERECNDLFGIKFYGHPDPRRLVLPDDWPQNTYPLRKSFSYNTKPSEELVQPTQLKKPEEGKTVIPIGPFYPSLEEPAYFRLIVDGEDIVDFDYRGFYVHRGIEKLGESALNYQQIPFLAERICGICGLSTLLPIVKLLKKQQELRYQIKQNLSEVCFLNLREFIVIFFGLV